MLLCALVNDDLIQENIISYCFLRCYIYVSLLLTRLHMRLNCGMCLLQTSRGTDDVKRRLRPRVNPDLLSPRKVVQVIRISPGCNCFFNLQR